MSKPQRHRKDDRLIHHGASPVEIECDFATGPFDGEARRMDAKWGQDRLPDLVSAETAARWGMAMANLNAALDAEDPQLVVARVNACLRGFAAMDAEATAAGHRPITPDAWEVVVDGVTCAILKDDASWPRYAELRPGVRIYSLREVGNALAHYGGMVAAVKEAFPGARVAAVRERTALEAELNDEVPW